LKRNFNAAVFFHFNRLNSEVFSVDSARYLRWKTVLKY